MRFAHIAERELHERHINTFYDLALIVAIAFTVFAVTSAL